MEWLPCNRKGRERERVCGVCSVIMGVWCGRWVVPRVGLFVVLYLHLYSYML